MNLLEDNKIDSKISRKARESTLEASTRNNTHFTSLVVLFGTTKMAVKSVKKKVTNRQKQQMKKPATAQFESRRAS